MFWDKSCMQRLTYIVNLLDMMSLKNTVRCGLNFILRMSHDGHCNVSPNNPFTVNSIMRHIPYSFMSPYLPIPRVFTEALLCTLTLVQIA